MLSEDEIRQSTIHNQAVCIFPTGDNQSYSILTNENRLEHKRQAAGIYNSFTEAVLRVFHQFLPYFGVENAYRLPFPFVFAGALKSRCNTQPEFQNLITTMLRRWPTQETNIELDSFLMPVSWSVEAFAFENQLELQNVQADGNCFFYTIGWMSMPVDQQNENSNVRNAYTKHFKDYCMTLKRVMLDFMLKFLTDTWEPEKFSILTGEKSTSFLEILVQNYEDHWPDERFMTRARVELLDSKYTTLYDTQIGIDKLQKVYAVYYNFIDPKYNRYGDLHTFGDLLCSILNIKEGIRLINNEASCLRHSSKCGRLFNQSTQQTWDSELAKIQNYLVSKYKTVLGIHNMYLLLKQGRTENGNHYMAMRPVNPHVQENRISDMFNWSKQLQLASTPQQPAAHGDASAYFARENPPASVEPHQESTNKTLPVHSAGSSAAVAEVAELRQLASARNAAKHAAAAEVAELRQRASARNAAKDASKHAAEVLQARVKELRKEATECIMRDRLL